MFNKIVQNSQIKTNNYFLKGINANLRLLCFSSFFSFLLIPLKKSFKIFEDQFELYKSFCENNKNNTGRIYNFMHILAPHGPLLFDENGQKFSRNQSNDFKNYYSFLKYTDKKVLELIDTIKQNMSQIPLLSYTVTTAYKSLWILVLKHYAAFTIRTKTITNSPQNLRVLICFAVY